MRWRRQGLLQPLYYFPFPFLQCQFLLPSLWGAHAYSILSGRCSLCRLTFGPIFQIGGGCFLPRTKASSFSHFVLIWARKHICFPACLGNAGPHRGQHGFLCRCLGPLPPGTHCLCAYLVCWKSWILQAGHGCLQKTASIHCCDSVWVNTLESQSGLPASRWVRTQPNLEQKNLAAEKVSSWEKLPLPGPLTLSFIIVLAKILPAKWSNWANCQLQ